MKKTTYTYTAERLPSGFWAVFANGSFLVNAALPSREVAEALVREMEGRRRG